MNTMRFDILLSFFLCSCVICQNHEFSFNLKRLLLSQFNPILNECYSAHILKDCIAHSSYCFKKVRDIYICDIPYFPSVEIKIGHKSPQTPGTLYCKSSNVLFCNADIFSSECTGIAEFRYNFPNLKNKSQSTNSSDSCLISNYMSNDLFKNVTFKDIAVNRCFSNQTSQSVSEYNMKNISNITFVCPKCSIECEYEGFDLYYYPCEDNINIWTKKSRASIPDSVNDYYLKDCISAVR